MNSAHDLLEKVKDVLHDFVKDIEEIQSIRKNMSAPQMVLAFTVADRMPIFDASTFTTAPDSAWEKDDAYTWVYGATCHHPLMHRMGLSRPLPSFYSQPTQPLFEKWLGKFLDAQNIPDYRIPDPLGGEKVHSYLERLQSILIHEKECRKIWWHSLRSFTKFLRDQARLIEDFGELDVIFPEDMTIYFDTILRKVPITLYPIDVWAAADILKILSHFVLEGRPNSQESAAQALGLAWVCLANGNARFMTRLELLYGLHPSSVKAVKQEDPFIPNHWLNIRTCIHTER